MPIFKGRGIKNSETERAIKSTEGAEKTNRRRMRRAHFASFVLFVAVLHFRTDARRGQTSRATRTRLDRWEKAAAHGSPRNAHREAAPAAVAVRRTFSSAPARHAPASRPSTLQRLSAPRH